MSDGGKGCTPRPILIPKEEYKEKWNSIFGDKPTLTGYCKKCDKKFSWCECKKTDVRTEMEKAGVLPNPYVAK